jgi:hypothetical protein
MVAPMNDAALQWNAGTGVRLRSAVPGRFRLFVPGLYRNDELGRTLERGLNGSQSRRTVSANVLAATVLVIAPEDAAAEALVHEVEALVQRFAGENAIALDELTRRGRTKPKHLMLNGSSGPLFALPHLSRKAKR